MAPGLPHNYFLYLSVPMQLNYSVHPTNSLKHLQSINKWKDMEKDRYCDPLCHLLSIVLESITFYNVHNITSAPLHQMSRDKQSNWSSPSATANQSLLQDAVWTSVFLCTHGKHNTQHCTVCYMITCVHLNMANDENWHCQIYLRLPLLQKK